MHMFDNLGDSNITVSIEHRAIKSEISKNSNDLIIESVS